MSDVWRIFVVVGEDALNQNIVNSLLKDGYVVQGVMSGADAVRVLWSEEYDIVICDLKTPGTDGFELLQWLRIYRPNTQMIMLGEANSPALRMQALESGAVSYFERPIDLRLLREELRRFLQQTGFTASLDSFDLLDVIQIITMGRRSMALLINIGLEERGILCFQNGDLVWAEYGVLRGEEAFFALAAHKNGTVTQQPWNEQIDANVTQPLSRLIFQALQYRTKYADRQQYSGEIASVPPTSFPPFSEIDDTPFMVLTEHETPEQAPFFPQPMGLQEGAYQSSQTNTNMSSRIQPESFSATNFDDASLTPTMALDSGEIKALLQRQNEAPVPLQRQNEPAVPLQRQNEAPVPLQRQNESPVPLQATMPVSPTADLPDWLTDSSTISPSQAMFPVNPPRGEPVPFMPTTPGDYAQSDEWYQPQPVQATTNQLPDGSANALLRNDLPETETLRRSSPDWSSIMPAQTPTVEPQKFAQASHSNTNLNRNRMPGQSSDNYADSNTNLNRNKTTDQSSDNYSRRVRLESAENPKLSTSSVRAQQAAQRNYPALMNALQTLGYGVPGFIAAALVTIEGHSIADVAIDDVDRSLIYQYIGTFLTQTTRTMEKNQWGAFEHTVVSSAERRLVIRVVSAEKSVFQVLIVAHDTDPAACLETMANVEGSISAALR